MFSLVNKHEEFFDFLVTNAECFHKGALLVKEVLQDPTKLERNAKMGQDLEHEADRVTHEVAAKMKHVFITPIDREDFYMLSSNLDDCVDDIKDVIFSLRIYHAGLGKQEPIRMSEILIEIAAELKELFSLLKNVEKHDAEITERTRKVNQLESEADTIYREFISGLFDGNHEAVEIIRWKEIMETMEETADQGEKVANLIKEVVMKYA